MKYTENINKRYNNEMQIEKKQKYKLNKYSII
jgi:hypothetical protein